jgi:hypothetical protein
MLAGQLPALRGDGLMKKIQGTPLLVTLLAGAGMAVVSLPVPANVAAECRQEAEDYEIPPEQTEDYVTGCILSRGGEYTPEPAVPDAAQDHDPPADTASTDADDMGGYYTDEAGTGDGNLPE